MSAADTQCLSELMRLCSAHAPCKVEISVSEAAEHPLITLACDARLVSTYTFKLPSTAPKHPFTLVSTWHVARDEPSYTNSIAAMLLAKALLADAPHFRVFVRCECALNPTNLRDELMQVPGVDRHPTVLLCNGQNHVISV